MRASVPPLTIRGTLFALLAIAFVPLVGASAWEVARSYADRRDVEARASLELARSVAAAAGAFVQDVVRAERAIGMLFGTPRSSPVEVERALAHVVAARPAVRDMSWLDRNGHVVVSTEPQLAGKSFFARDYFQDIAHGAGWRVSPVLRSVVDDRATFIVATGIRDSAGALAWVVVAAVDAERFGAVILQERGTPGFTSIRDAHGTLAALVPARALTWEERHRGIQGEWIQRALAGAEQVGTYASPLTGERRVGATVPVEGLGWLVTASRSFDEAMTPARRGAILHAAVLLAILVASFAAALYVAHRIASSLRALEVEADQLAHGGEPRADVTGSVEVRRVAVALRAMAAGLAERSAELDELQDERETLMRSVSHDLRTPLGVIVAQATLLQRRIESPEQQRRADAILASAGRMNRLIGDLVDAARLDEGHLELRLEPVDLGRYLVEWRERVATAMAVERVRIDLQPTVPAVRADPARLDQIVGNLVSNALKYSLPDSEVRVELTASATELRLAVTDRGPGIAPDELPRLFERYYRAKGAGAEGLGLGLFITRKLVEAHGWLIEVESELGKGSVFTVVVPVSRASVDHPTSSAVA